jgi:hypothetical protein
VVRFFTVLQIGKIISQDIDAHEVIAFNDGGAYILVLEALSDLCSMQSIDWCEESSVQGIASLPLP